MLVAGSGAAKPHPSQWEEAFSNGPRDHAAVEVHCSIPAEARVQTVLSEVARQGEVH